MDELLICDTCVFIALWKEDDVARQQIYSKYLFERIEKDGEYKVLFTDLNQSEIRKKYPIYEDSFIGLKTRFCQAKKGQDISIKILSKKEKFEVLNLKEEAEKLGYGGLSFADCLFFLTAKKRRVNLVTWEYELYDFAREKRLEIYNPDELVSFE